MSRNYWFKMSHDLFQNSKIKYLRKMENGERMVLLWVFLLTLPKPISGKLQLAPKVPLTSAVISELSEMDKALVDKALDIMAQLKMLRKKDGFYYVVGWRSHQKSEWQLTRERERNKVRQARYRQQKKEQNCHTPNNEKKQNCHAPIREEKNRTEKKREEKDIVRTICQMYDTLCPSLAKRGKLSAGQKEHIQGLTEEYKIEHIHKIFEKAEKSKFLRGDNTRHWRASFDWLIQPENAGKVCCGLYDDYYKPDSHSGSMTEFERSTLQKLLED